MDAPAKPERLFFALWPALPLQRQLYGAIEPLLKARRDGKRARAEKLHLTLAFLGAVDSDIRCCLERHADSIRVPPFDIVFDRLGSFRRRGLLWIGPPQVPAPLAQLALALNRAQAACGLVPEQRMFAAHVTLVRGLRRCPAQTLIAPMVWPVREFVLVRSELGAGGARYEIVGRWPLAGLAS
jgi:RNA 2',3'-cyclic 3'-phosphodiesterase